MNITLKVFVKTSASLLGTILMNGGDLIFSEMSLLGYLGIDNQPAKITVSSLSFLSMTYILIFSRGISLWDYYSRVETLSNIDNSQNNIQEINEGENEVNPIVNKVGYAIGVFASCSIVPFFLFTSYLASETLFKSINVDELAPQVVGWVYIWISLVIVYFNFAHPRAINNGKDVAAIFLRDENVIADPQQVIENKKALKKTIICASLGTFSFSTLSLFFTQNAVETMPLVGKSPKELQLAISILISVTSSIVFALSKSMETYQYFSNNRHFKKEITPINRYPAKARFLLRTHQVIGICFLALIFASYYRSNLNLIQHLGADIDLSWKNTPFFLIAIIFSFSSTFMALLRNLWEFKLIYEGFALKLPRFASGSWPQQVAATQ
jgi:hypothetical protein